MANESDRLESRQFLDENQPVVELDEMDTRILSLLAEDARLSMREIARRVSLSPNSVAERISRLEERGVLLGYHARIAPSVLGYRLEAIIGLQTTQSISLEDILRELMKVPEVEGAYVVSGDWDVVVRLRVRDHQHLRNVVVGQFWPMHAFQRSQTMVVFDTYERPGGWNVALALEEALKRSDPKQTH
jgi:DNA-binding Lrp family transcriptional regulator